MKSRRNFIQHCSSAILGTAVLPASAITLKALGAGRLPNFTAFSNHLDSQFTVTMSDGRAVPVILEEVRPMTLGNKVELADHRNFSLKFASNCSKPKTGGMCTFDHPALGSFDLHVNAAVSNKTGNTNFIAIFHGAPLTA